MKKQQQKKSWPGPQEGEVTAELQGVREGNLGPWKLEGVRVSEGEAIAQEKCPVGPLHVSE